MDDNPPCSNFLRRAWSTFYLLLDFILFFSHIGHLRMCVDHSRYIVVVYMANFTNQMLYTSHGILLCFVCKHRPRVDIPRHWGLSKCPRRASHLLGSDASFGGVHFFGPPYFGPLGTFLVYFLLNLGSTAPNHSRRRPMRSSKAPPNQKK